MFWGMREDRQHLAMSLHCLTTSQPQLAGFWLILCMTRLCPSCHGKFTLCHHLGGAHVGTALQKRSSVSTQILAFLGEGMCKGYKTSYVHIGKMGKSEKISLFSKRKLFDFFSQPFAWTVQLSFSAGRWHCYTGKHFPMPARPKRMVYFPCVFLHGFPSLGPGHQVANVVFPQSCTELPN